MKGKITLVTGAARGIGRTIAEFLAEKGSDIALFDVIDGVDAAAAVEAKGARALFLNVDVTDFQQVEAAVKKVVAEMGGLDNVVNNAGITRDRLLLRMSEDEWDQVIRINMKGVFNCTKAAIRHLLKKGGSIVNIASIAGLAGNPGQSNYAASKAGIIGFTKSVAKEYGERNVRVNAVAPGFIRTDMTVALDEKYREMMTQAVPLKRAGEPVDVARVVYFLLSDYSSYVTGEVINVSGGLYI
ncbi:MAG: 3-oxoacyl-(acyl-carrier-protein) reductase FabG [Syntrophorhabdaceae bacterium PtaU1.Bin034]|jgi:3-oxoacyl-[acyl-carrier protein] reductase|nr:MAG: 3-oxoacyl-(acyl-carrier-protein) reductase FabG [Syntrophorhabdaceae bacterium PtaU1.Bin034]